MPDSLNFTNITVVGSGYVGMSLAVLLAQKNEVTVLDIDHDRIEKINNLESTVEDKYIEKYLKTKKVNLKATSEKKLAYSNANIVVIATPTNYDPNLNYFDTSSIDNVLDDIFSINKDLTIVIKSTIPISYTEKLQEKFSSKKIFFSPEFLREGKALYDNLYPSRIIVGSNIEEAQKFASILKDCALSDDIPVLFMQSREAEAIKLFSNTYLAMRIAFFNELDSFSLKNNLNSEDIINGMSHDERIGGGYNNPSFGYGGYCLPKDTKQLLANYSDVPQKLISAIVESNEVRKDFVSDFILNKKPKKVGFYRLVMKEGSDNFRDSAIQGIIERFKKNKVEIYIYEPLLNNDYFEDCIVETDLKIFKENSDIIIANRVSDDISDVSFKTFSRDIFNEN